MHPRFSVYRLFPVVLAVVLLSGFGPAAASCAAAAPTEAASAAIAIPMTLTFMGCPFASGSMRRARPTGRAIDLGAAGGH